MPSGGSSAMGSPEACWTSRVSVGRETSPSSGAGGSSGLPVGVPVVLVDSSAWIAFLRGSSGSVVDELRLLLAEPGLIGTTEIIVMELVAGARSEDDATRLRERLIRLPMLTLRGLHDFEAAADLFRRCRAAGETIRSLTDCLIAVCAIRADAQVLHSDRDFDAIARHSELRIHPLPRRRT